MDKPKNDCRHVVYALGKFSSACTELAIGIGDIKPRLLAASDKFWAVSPEMLPPEIQQDFLWVRAQLMKSPPLRDGEGEVVATIRKMHRKTCVEIARRILLIESSLREYLDLGKTY